MCATSQLVRTPCRGKRVAIGPQRGHENHEKRDRQGEETKGDGVVDPPDQKEQRSHRQAQQRLHLAHAHRHPAVGLDEHFDGRNEVEEQGQAAQVNAPLPPSAPRVYRARPGKTATLAAAYKIAATRSQSRYISIFTLKA